MQSDSSDDEMVRSTASSTTRSSKRPRFETDEEDLSSDDSVSSLDSSSDSDEDDTPDFAYQDEHRVVARRPGFGPLRRPRRGAGRARADDFVATVRLMSEVEALRRQRDELMSLHYARVLNTGNRDGFINTTIEYYDTFRDGFRGPRVPDIYRFFDNRLDKAIFAYGGGGLGLDTWIEQWHRYMRIFPSIGIQLRSTSFVDLVDPLDGASLGATDASTTTCMVDAHGTMTGVISRQAIDTLLPHLRHREDLVHKLLDKPLNCPTTLRFHFNERGRIILLDFNVDFFQAFSNVADVGLFEVIHMMEQVTVGDCSLLPEVVGEGSEERVLEENS